MSLRQKTIQGFLWFFGAQVFRQISQFIIMAILARLLSPYDFGLIGMITVYFGFALMFGELGVSAALIQKQDVNEAHYSSAFWLNVFVGIILNLIFWLSAPLIAGFYAKPVLIDLIRVISISCFISSLSIVHSAKLQKEMDFKAISFAESIALLFAGGLGIYSASRGFGVWSLVFNFMGFISVKTCLLWIFSSWRPNFLFSKQAIKEIFHFSANITGFNIVEYFARNIDYLLIGKFLGAGALGFYTLAYKIMLYPLQNVSNIIGGVMFPAFSRIQDDLEKVRINYLKMIRAISLVTFPLMLGLFVLAPEFIRVVFGPQWTPVIPIVKILCFCGMFQSIESAVGNIFRSQNRSDLHLRMQIFGTIIVTICISIGLQWGLKGVAYFYALYTFAWVLFSFHVCNKLIGLGDNKLLKAIYPALLISGIITLVISLIKYFFLNTDLNVLLVSSFAALIIYFMFLVLTKQLLISKNGVVLNI
ncbi:MAG: MOP flippase family protein [Candidatus Omnitrophica bacterium]|nr:MOP flippase family protein [Candidatus Omnitrophota bacterium]